MKAITITRTIFVERHPEMVWDFTQDYTKRPLWDSSVREAKELQSSPRIVRVYGPVLCADFIYKQNDRPHKTSLAMANISSRLIEGGGGSWVYAAKDNGTEWTQTNTVTLRDTFAVRMLGGVLSYLFRWNTKKAMQRAKRMIEQTIN